MDGRAAVPGTGVNIGMYYALNQGFVNRLAVTLTIRNAREVRLQEEADSTTRSLHLHASRDMCPGQYRTPAMTASAMQQRFFDIC